MNAHRDTILTGSSLRNGRIYFSATDAPFFGVHRLGDRAGKEPGTPVEIRVHGETHVTDIRTVSGVRIGPRKSFASWLRAIRAQEGARVRMTRVGEYCFMLDYLG